MTNEQSVTRIVIGTAGHIDHGKSALIQRLTGIDPDRLEEEKRRGMTIDLGFAHIKLEDGRRVGFIDVPGHEKFVRNMVAGATAIHAVMLVVAADDSVMPQTREHLSILRFLDVPEGMVALTKCDLVDADTLELVKEDIENEVRGTFLEGKPIFPVSSITGEGIEALYAEIKRLCDQLQDREARGVFRYPIQRVFSRTGFGTVFTGVPASGSSAIGDVLEVVPGGEKCRVRKLQAYHTDVNTVYAGHCAAMNVSDLAKDDCERGMVVSAPGMTRTASSIEVRLTYLPMEKDRVFKDYAEVSFHAGSAEVPGNVALMGGVKQLLPGETCYAQVRLAKPIAAWTGQHFVIRRISPADTLGGGIILAMTDRKLRRSAPETLEFFEHRSAALSAPDNLAALVIDEAAGTPVPLAAICVETGLTAAELAPMIRAIVEQGRAVETARDQFASASAIAGWKASIVKGMDAMHKGAPLITWHDRAALRKHGPESDAVFDLCVSGLVASGALEIQGGKVKRTGYKPPISAADSALLDRIRDWVKSTPFDSHSQNTVAVEWKLPPDTVARLYRLLCESGELVALPDGVFLHAEAVKAAEAKLMTWFETNPALVSGDFKGLIGAARKVAISLLDHFEKTGLTYRNGNQHLPKRYSGRQKS